MSFEAKRRAWLLLGASACLPVVASAAFKPARPVRLVVVYPPGGVSDTIARYIADRLGEQLGVPVLVEHRAGDGGSVGMAMLARAAPDGLTLAFSAITPLTVRPLVGEVNYDPLRDVLPVAGVMHTPLLVVATPAFDVSTLAGALAIARARPGRLRWASSGFATTGHMVMEQVCLASGARIVHIPYKGGSQQLTDAVGGQFELLSTNVGDLQLRYIKTGHFKPLAVGAPQRLPGLPRVPTFAELGFPLANLSSLFGIFAPSGTPEPVLDGLNAAINAVLRTDDFKQRLLATDNIPATDSRQAFAAQIAQDFAANQQLVRTTKIRLQ
jgi:tripartite-type tricarboxylate transporter receptor subunit TctC